MKVFQTAKSPGFLLLITLVALLIGSCQKEGLKDYTYECTLCGTNTASEFLKRNAPQAQIFDRDISQQIEVEGEQGTKISVAPNSFADMAGNVVSGTVRISLKEIYSPGQIILADKMTTSNGRILSSGGELYLNFQQAGEDLQLIDGKSISVKVPASDPDPAMELFTGGQDSNGEFTWEENDTPVRSCTDSSSISFPSGYCFDLKELFKWINCDYFYSDPRPLTMVEVAVPQGYDTSNTRVFGYIPSENAMIGVGEYQNQSFWLGAGYRLPVGLDVIFIGVYSDGGGKFGYAVQQNTIVDKHYELLKFNTVTEQQLLQFLAGL